jgi:hypothetical protein
MPLYIMHGGGTLPPKPQSLTNFGQVNREAVDQPENKSLQENVHQRSLPNYNFYGIHFDGGNQIRCPLLFIDSRLN